MLPFQQPPADERMALSERLEWAVMIVGLLLWWPKLFVQVYQPAQESPAYQTLLHLAQSPVYGTVIYVLVPLALLAILIRRLRRFLTVMRQQEEEHDRRFPPKSQM